MTISPTPIILALLLSILHLFSERFTKLIEKYHARIISFSSGILIALIFLYLLPEVIEGSDSVNVFAFILIGFTVFHLTEKYLYQHVTNKKELLHELAELHVLGFFVDHFALGVVLVLTSQVMSGLTILIFIPFVFHTISSALTLEHIHEKSKTHFNKILLASSTLIGALVASISNLRGNVFFAIFAFTIGLLFYIVVRDMLPKGKKGNPFAFLIGILLVLLINFIELYI